MGKAARRWTDINFSIKYADTTGNVMQFHAERFHDKGLPIEMESEQAIIDLLDMASETYLKSAVLINKPFLHFFHLYQSQFP